MREAQEREPELPPQGLGLEDPLSLAQDTHAYTYFYQHLLTNHS